MTPPLPRVQECRGFRTSSIAGSMPVACPLPSGVFPIRAPIDLKANFLQTSSVKPSIRRAAGSTPCSRFRRFCLARRGQPEEMIVSLKSSSKSGRCPSRPASFLATFWGKTAPRCPSPSRTTRPLNTSSRMKVLTPCVGSSMRVRLHGPASVFRNRQ